MKQLLVICICLVLCGCSIERRLSRYCPYCPREVVTMDSTRHTTESVTETVYVVNPADSLLVRSLAECDSSNRAQMPETIAESNNQKVAVSIVDGQLTVLAECKEDSLRVELEHTREYIERLKNTRETVTVQVKVYPGKFFYW